MRTILKLLLVAILLAFTVFFNANLIDIRMEEIRYYLGNIASKQDASNTFGIVARYELIKRRMVSGEDNASDLELEARIQALTSGEKFKEIKGDKLVLLRKIPVRIVLNSIRYVLGKPIINPKNDDKIFDVLEIAYFWERNRRYSEALKIYDDVLGSSTLASEIRASVLVHQAFCHSMLSNYEKSKSVYEKVISEFPSTEAGIVSWRLLEFINSMENERKKLENKRLSRLEKAKQFYLFMDFRSAIKSVSKYLQKNSKHRSAVEARYYKGRAHEELGETEEAMMEYKMIIKKDKSKKWAKKANRRMLMLGEFYEQKKQIAEEARRQLEAYQDEVFTKNMEVYSGMVNLSSLKGELTLETGGTETAAEENDSVMNLINKIGTVDLTGEESKRAQKEKDKRLKKSIREQASKMSTPELKELQRRKDLASNPYRKPSFIKKTIDKNSSELRYIYNKRLRSGDELSGKVVMEIRISPDGSVAGARPIMSTVGDERFEGDIAVRVEGWQFKKVPDSLGVLTVNFPFEFYEEQ
ncbi:MAG: AgmX/PglI C-terminal domain-containing protein [Chitinispirillaceae bacterium]